MLHICCPPLHRPFLPPKGTKPVPSPTARTGQQHPTRRTTAFELAAFVRSGSDDGIGGRWTNRARAREREGRGRGGERERRASLTEAGRLGRRSLACSIPCAGMQGEEEEAGTGRGASCRWNCSLWQRWVVCSNILPGHSAPLGRGCVNFPGSHRNCRPILCRILLGGDIICPPLLHLRPRLRSSGALLCGLTGSAEGERERACSQRFRLGRRRRQRRRTPLFSERIPPRIVPCPSIRPGVRRWNGCRS